MREVKNFEAYMSEMRSVMSSRWERGRERERDEKGVYMCVCASERER